MRLFVAIQFSSNVIHELQRIQHIFARYGRGSFTKEENLHLTLAFIGETNRCGDAIDALRQIRGRFFPLTLGGIGHFDNLYWVGIRPSPALQELQQQVTTALLEAGFAIESRAFIPHLTICRHFCPDASFDLRRVEQCLSAVTCQIRDIRLLESHRPNGRLTYTERYRITLH